MKPFNMWSGSLPPAIRKASIAFLLFFAMCHRGSAQVSNYLFVSSAGTYAPITGGTLLTAGTSWDNQVYPVTLPSPFFFNGVWYPSMFVSCNGFITFGTTATGTNYKPLSSTENYSGAISPFGTNIWRNTLTSGGVRWQQVGREVVVQWADARRFTSTGNHEHLSFQARLNLDNGVIRFVYGPVLQLNKSLERFPQVGLRGANNSFPANVNNREVDAIRYWGASTKGTSNLALCRFTSKIPARSPANGLTFTYAWNGGMELSITADNNGSQTSWMIQPVGSNTPLCSGSGYASNTTTVVPCLVTQGQYVLKVLDSLGDGLCCLQGTGGYVLRDLIGRRIIDNRDNGKFTLTSSVDLPFDLPLGSDHIVDSLADREHLFTQDYVQAQPNDDVRAQWLIGNQADDGYQWWFYNPNGGYSRRLFMALNANNYQFPAGPDRCTFMRLGNLTANILPLNILLNVKVRSRVNGVYRSWGPATRLKIDLPALCPIVQLIDEPGTPHHSCGLTNVLLHSSKFLWATFIPTATKYKFNFTAPGFNHSVTSISSTLLLNGAGTAQLQYNRTYQVRVATSYDNGATWCPYGPACSLTTAPQAPQDQTRAFIADIPASDADLKVWPNPCDGGPLNVNMSGLPADARTAQLRLLDPFGKLAGSSVEAVGDGELNTVFECDHSLASGVYFLSITVKDQEVVRRVVIP